MVGVFSFFKTIFKGIKQFFGFFSLNRMGHLQTTLILLVIACIILIGHPAEIFGSQSNEIGIVTVNKLNMRSEPGKRFAPSKLLKKGTKVKILERLNGWLKIEHQGRVGYISNQKRYVRIIKEHNIEIEGDRKSYLDSKIEHLKKEAEGISREIEQHESEVLAFSEKEATIINDLNKIDIALNKAMKRVAAIKFELVALEKMINKTENASKKLMKKIKTSEIYAFERLVALYKLSWLGSMSFLASAESIYELFKRKAALKHILAYDENILEDLEKNKNSLHKLLDRLNTQKKEKLNLEANYKKQIRIMSHKEKKRSKLLADIRNKKSLEMALIESLKEAANSLNQTMKSLSIGIDHPKQKQLTINFASYKGLLNMPVQGKIVSHFGPYKSSKFNITYFRKGIDIKADRGEPIRAVCAGKILYSDWFRGYGNMIIIDHGNNYYTVYAHAEEIFKTKGNTVETKEVIATVGDTGSIIGPGLYFEVRYHGKPMNPLVWIKKG